MDMASLSLPLGLLPASRSHHHLKLGFPSNPQIHSSIATFKFSPPSSSTFRCIGTRRLEINQRLLTVYATKSNFESGKSGNEVSDVKETSNVSQGPPLLTILAGIFVFFLVCWVIGSIVTWLISLIVNVPPPK